MSSIEVALRARPWVLDDRLGIDMQQVGPEQGTIQLLNSDYSTTFFSFSYSWWTAFNYKHHCDAKDMEVCENMKFVSQEDVYNSVGQKIKKDLYEGNAVVLFAYGLSGSGKTYTVFGMDDVKNKTSWFYHKTPDKNWGVFPRLGYDVFTDRKDGWKVTMKYFQNVVDIVRDLMSPVGTEKVYKEGMRKDADGFMDIEWCQSAVLNSWDELRKTFLAANARKAIAPTQFNHQSTRGHCIMTIEVLMPDEENPDSKKRGRVYVCDLAGTEPAGDIFFANYQAVTMSDGTIEQKLLGPHQDQKRTKELQDQGKKINLSLSEMAQFFMKMAEAFKAKKLKPGVSIPGCNTYFLCKYLKDIMLNSKTYLFCAIRPEVTYLKYTFATLNFAKNASVVQLAPKKASAAMSPAERKLMMELEKYKAMVEEMKKSGGGGGGGDEVAALQAMLAKQQEDLQRMVNSEGSDPAAAAVAADAAKRKKQYTARGITLWESVEDVSTLKAPFFVNIDEDEFRTKRFLYILKNGETNFGPGGDMRPPSFSVVKNHCRTHWAGEGCELECLDGPVWTKGKKNDSGSRVSLASGDWVVMGTETFQFFSPGSGVSPDESDLEQIFSEIAAAQRATPAAADTAASSELAERIAELERQNQELVSSSAAGGEKGGANAAPSFDEAEVMNVIQLIKDVNDMCGKLDRGDLDFEPVLARQDTAAGGQGKTFIKVTHVASQQTSLVSDADFAMKCSQLRDEIFSLTMSFESGEEYEVSDSVDPMSLFFSDMYHIASGRHFCEYLAYYFETEQEDKDVSLVESTSPYGNAGILNIDWKPLPADGAAPDEIAAVEDLIGRPWKFKLSIRNAAIKIRASRSYVSYVFPDESGTLSRHNTDVCEKQGSTPTFDYEAVHEVGCVTQQLVDFLSGKNGMDFEVFAAPVFQIPKNRISTTNPNVAKNFHQNVVQSGPEREMMQLAEDKAQLTKQLEAAMQEIAKATGEDVSKVRTRLVAAQIADANVNGAAAPAD
mmetsp:Transcript_25426/g.85436  ORF Transcript_25426/g.85436 Transcript_25426/m.85436 type:complete len:1005 (-) Transcript_25426:54-3068(-)